MRRDLARGGAVLLQDVASPRVPLRAVGFRQLRPDTVPHERVGEATAPRRIRHRCQQAGVRQRREAVDNRGQRLVQDAGQQHGIDLLAEQRSDPEQTLLGRWDVGEHPRNQVLQGRAVGEPALDGRRIVRIGETVHSQDLHQRAQVERVATRARVHQRDGVTVDRPPRRRRQVGGDATRAQRAQGQQVGAGWPGRRLARRGDHQQPAAPHVASEVPQQVTRDRVGPVQVLEDHHQAGGLGRRHERVGRRRQQPEAMGSRSLRVGRTPRLIPVGPGPRGGEGGVVTQGVERPSPRPQRRGAVVVEATPPAHRDAR